jgi:hypothetical protein
MMLRRKNAVACAFSNPAEQRNRTGPCPPVVVHNRVNQKKARHFWALDATCSGQNFPELCSKLRRDESCGGDAVGLNNGISRYRRSARSD